MRVLGEPGSNFLYHPIVFGRLANWVEEQTGKPYAYWLHKYVIDPAGLENTAAGWRDPAAAESLLFMPPGPLTSFPLAQQWPHSRTTTIDFPWVSSPIINGVEMP